MGNKRMGRPTDSPKDTTLKIRMDKDSLEKLEFCSKKLSVSRAEVIRSSIRKTYDDLQK